MIRIGLFAMACVTALAACTQNHRAVSASSDARREPARQNGITISGYATVGVSR